MQGNYFAKTETDSSEIFLTRTKYFNGINRKEIDFVKKIRETRARKGFFFKISRKRGTVMLYSERKPLLYLTRAT